MGSRSPSCSEPEDVVDDGRDGGGDHDPHDAGHDGRRGGVTDRLCAAPALHAAQAARDRHDHAVDGALEQTRREVGDGEGIDRLLDVLDCADVEVKIRRKLKRFFF